MCFAWENGLYIQLAPKKKASFIIRINYDIYLAFLIYFFILFFIIIITFWGRVGVFVVFNAYFIIFTFSGMKWNFMTSKH